MFRANDQVRVDRGRKTYRISFPADMAARDVHNWMGSVFGVLRAPGLAAPPNMAFETWADPEGIVHRLKVPENLSGDVSAQLRTLVPGINLQEDDEPLEHDWTVWFEYKEINKARTLKLPDPNVMSARLVGSFQDIGEGEQILVQWVVTAARNEAAPAKAAPVNHWLLKKVLQADGDIDDRSAKLNEPNLNAVCRVAVRAASVPRALQIAGNVNNRFKGLGGAHNGIVRRTYADKHKLLERVRYASGMMNWPIKLSLTEFISLMVWPIGSPHVAGYASGMPRQLAPAAGISRDGTVVGIANFSGAERRLAISDAAGCRHTYVCGMSGSGKTVMLTNIAVQRMNKGEGLFVIESKGDLFYETLARIPPPRLKDVVVIDVDDTDYPVGYDLLAQGSNRQAIDQLSRVVTSIAGDGSNLVHAPKFLHYGLHALASVPGHTFVDLPALLTPQSPEEAHWREELVEKIPDRQTRRFWQLFLNKTRRDQDSETSSLHNRMWQLVDREEIRNIFGQANGRFSVAEAIRQKKIVLVFLNEARVGRTTASVAGTFLFNDLWTQMRLLKPSQRVTLLMDEFQDFMRYGIDAEQMLYQARSFNLDMVLAHQNADQIDRKLMRGIVGNMGTQLIFRVGKDDGRLFADQFGRAVSPDDFLNQGPHEIIGRIMMDNGNASPPVTAKTLPPSRHSGMASTAREMSRQQYGTPVAQVEAEMESRRQPKGSRKPPKEFGGTEWPGGKR